jgi:hypothetical protein
MTLNWCACIMHRYVTQSFYVIVFMLCMASRRLLYVTSLDRFPVLLCLHVATVVLILFSFTTGAEYVCLFSRLVICLIDIPLCY